MPDPGLWTFVLNDVVVIAGVVDPIEGVAAGSRHTRLKVRHGPPVEARRYPPIDRVRGGSAVVLVRRANSELSARMSDAHCAAHKVAPRARTVVENSRPELHPVGSLVRTIVRELN